MGRVGLMATNHTVQNDDDEPDFYPCDVCGEEVCDAPSSTCIDCQNEEEDE